MHGLMHNANSFLAADAPVVSCSCIEVCHLHALDSGKACSKVCAAVHMMLVA